MRTTKLIGFGLIAFLGLCGCATPGELSDNDLLKSYALSRVTVLTNNEAEERAEILKRKLLSPEEIDRADLKDVRLGDSRELVLAAWGNPDNVSNLETNSGVFESWRYRASKLGPERGGSVYLRNGIVTGISR